MTEQFLREWRAAILNNSRADIERLCREFDEPRQMLLAVHDALHRECDGSADLPKEIRQLRASIDGLRSENLSLRVHAAALYDALHELMLQRVPRDSIAPEALKARKALEDYSP